MQQAPDLRSANVQAKFEMEDFAIPEEYFSCHATRLFDLLADSLVTFAKRHGFRCAHCLLMFSGVEIWLTFDQQQRANLLSRWAMSGHAKCERACTESLSKLHAVGARQLLSASASASQ